MSDFDIAIVGGGLVGTSLAAALSHTKLRVVLIEAAAPPSGTYSWDERCIALNDASRRIFSAIGLWDVLRAEAEPIVATHISERDRFGTTRFSAAEAGLDALGYNVPLRAIGAVLTQALATAPNLSLMQPARLAGVTLADDHAVLEIDAAGSLRTLNAKLVVAADGAHSVLRNLLGIAAQTRDYAQHAIVSAVRLSRPHKGVAYERFTPDGPLALIPKPDAAASLVWTVPSERAETMLGCSDHDYLAEAQDTFGGRLGRFTALGARRGYPLSRIMSVQLAAARTVLIGNAAQSLHPVAAQGFNLGLRDVAALAQAVATLDDPGAAKPLADYEQRRAHDRSRVSAVTDFMVRTFSNRIPGLAQARHWGLIAVDLAPPLRNAMLRQHLGQLGLPRDDFAARVEARSSPRE